MRGDDSRVTSLCRVEARSQLLPCLLRFLELRLLGLQLVQQARAKEVARRPQQVNKRRVLVRCELPPQVETLVVAERVSDLCGVRAGARGCG